MRPQPLKSNMGKKYKCKKRSRNMMVAENQQHVLYLFYLDNYLTKMVLIMGARENQRPCNHHRLVIAFVCINITFIFYFLL
jgi:hypothetical protein